MGCSTLAKGVQADCAAIKKIGGVDKRVWIGALDDLTAIAFGTDNIISSFTFASGKGFVHVSGKKDKNNGAYEVTRGENVTTVNQTVNLSVYWSTAAQLAALNNLVQAEQLFVVLETNAGMLEVYGVSAGASFDNFGLAPGGTGGTGTVMQDSTAFTFTLTGEQLNLPLLYAPGVALATNIAALDAQTIDPAP